MLKKPLSSGISSVSSSISTPPDGISPIPKRALRPAPSLSSLNAASRRLKSSHMALPETVVEIRNLETQPSLGELDAYPLRRSSAICKATGGGRWEPKQEPVKPWYRIPGGKAPYELDMEREEQQERDRRANPIVRDGG